jgi:hypothetical protein
MKLLTVVFGVIIWIGLAQASSFSFKEPLGGHPKLMFINFGEACFLRLNGHYEASPHLEDCLEEEEGSGGQAYVNAPTRSLADDCSTLNAFVRMATITNNDEYVNSYSFTKLSLSELDGTGIARAREACGQLARVFAAMPFGEYGKAVKECRKMVGTPDDCVRLLRTTSGVVVGFFFYESANDQQSQCETLKATQAQPPNLVCTMPWERISPDLRFRAEKNLSECPPLEPPRSVPPSCTDPKPEMINESPRADTPSDPTEEGK